MKLGPEEKIAAAAALLRNPFSEYSGLDKRERKALALLAEGYRARALAHKMDLTVRTTYNVVDRALAKVSKQEGKLITRDDVTPMVWRKLRRTLKNGK